MIHYFYAILSIFSLVSQEELQSGLEFWKKALKTGKADEYIVEREERRKSVGNSTSIVAYKH